MGCTASHTAPLLACPTVPSPISSRHRLFSVGRVYQPEWSILKLMSVIRRHAFGIQLGLYLSKNSSTVHQVQKQLLKISGCRSGSGPIARFCTPFLLLYFDKF